MGIAERRQKAKEDLRDLILAAARDLFANGGYDNFSMRKLAQRIEYSPTTIYLYFKDKDELLYVLCEETFNTLLKRYNDVLKGEDQPLELLRKVMLDYIAFGLSSPEQYKIAFSTTANVYGPREDFHTRDTFGRRLYDAVRGVIQRCIEEGLIRRLDPDLAAQGVWMAIHGVVSLLTTAKDFPWVDEKDLARHVVDLQIAGLRS